LGKIFWFLGKRCRNPVDGVTLADATGLVSSRTSVRITRSWSRRINIYGDLECQSKVPYQAFLCAVYDGVPTRSSVKANGERMQDALLQMNLCQSFSPRTFGEWIYKKQAIQCIMLPLRFAKSVLFMQRVSPSCASGTLQFLELLLCVSPCFCIVDELVHQGPFTVCTWKIVCTGCVERCSRR
jgi:hypothetical protein